MVKTFYITTTIPYANAPPHIGFALEIVQADVLARWNKLLGKDVFFLTGTDEHGSKNFKMAKEEKLTPQQFVDRNSSFFRELTEALNISNNYFIRTTDKKTHWPGVIKIWKAIEKKGDIYKKKYSGSYCNGCERFITDKDLIDEKCPDHPNLTPEEIAEENYFFKLSKYSDKITSLIKTGKLVIFPEKWKKDFLSLIKEGLTDVSFSRDKKHLPWGIPVPGDDSQVMYVWPDALTNYLTGIGFPNKKYKKYWPADVHVVGKDMLRFHTGIWPGMLLSAGIELPRRVIVHGFLTVDGQKMSKSLGNVVSPLELKKKYDSDTIRYYLMRTIPFGEDGNFSESALVSRHNNELANKLGNLVSRVSTLAEKCGIKKTKNELLERNLIGNVRPKKTDKIRSSRLKRIESHIENCELDKALNEIFTFVDYCNEYTQKTQPWKSGDKKIIYELADSIKAIAILLWPFIPETSEKIAKVFDFNLSLSSLKTPLKISKIKKAPILFEKKEQVTPQDFGSQRSEKTKDKRGNLQSLPFTQQNIKEEPKINKPQSANKIEGIKNMSEITYEEFTKLDLRVAQILEVADIEGADKIYKLTIDAGKELGQRTICAGLKQHYKKEALKGRKIIYLSNLAPKLMKGIESQGMLLAASTNEHSNVVFLTPKEDVLNGSSIEFKR